MVNGGDCALGRGAAGVGGWVGRGWLCHGVLIGVFGRRRRAGGWLFSRCGRSVGWLFVLGCRVSLAARGGLDFRCEVHFAWGAVGRRGLRCVVVLWFGVCELRIEVAADVVVFIGELVVFWRFMFLLRVFLWVALLCWGCAVWGVSCWLREGFFGGG